MKKIFFFMLMLSFLIPTSANSLELLNRNKFRSQTIYQAPMLNTRNFEDFIVFISRRNKNIIKYKTRIAKIIFENAYKYKLDPLTILALLANESKYKWWKKGELDELGMGQVRPSIWLAKRNRDNLHKAGIVLRHKPHQLKFIGKGIQSTSHILSVYRRLCTKWKRQKRLRRRGYRDINECMIRRYNGSSKDTYKYYIRVASYIGRYYYFIRRGEIVASSINNNSILTVRR